MEENPFLRFQSVLLRRRKEKIRVFGLGVSLGEYTRACIFEGDSPVRRTKGRCPVKDEQALAQVLGMLGQSKIPSNINQLTKAAHSGSLPVTPTQKNNLMKTTIRSSGFSAS